VMNLERQDVMLGISGPTLSWVTCEMWEPDYRKVM